MTDADLWVGGREYEVQEFEGNIADVRIWDVARPTTEIALIIAQPHWRMKVA